MAEVCPRYQAAQQSVTTPLSFDENILQSPGYFGTTSVAIFVKRGREVQKKTNASCQYHAP